MELTQSIPTSGILLDHDFFGVTLMNLFSGWADLLHIVVVGSCAYLSLIVLLRGYGKRTLSKINAFDFVVTIALGSILASVMLSKTVSLAEGVTALVLLMSWQFLFSWLASRSSRVRQIVASDPRLLVHDGEFIMSAMRSERVAEEEVMQALRKHGFEELKAIRSVVLEPDGTLSVIGLDSA